MSQNDPKDPNYDRNVHDPDQMKRTLDEMDKHARPHLDKPEPPAATPSAGPSGGPAPPAKQEKEVEIKSPRL